MNARAMTVRRWAAGAGVAAVAIVAGVISYSHQRHLAATHGQNETAAAIFPLAVDGLILACGVMVTVDRSGGFKPRVWAVVGFWLGVVGSVWANASATTGDSTARIISAFPAVALLIAVETLTSRPKKRQGAVVPIAQLPIAVPVPVEIADPEPMIESAKVQVTPRIPTRKSATTTPQKEDVREAARTAYLASVIEGKPLSGAALSRQFGRSPRWGVGIVADMRTADFENVPLPGLSVLVAA